MGNIENGLASPNNAGHAEHAAHTSPDISSDSGSSHNNTSHNGIVVSQAGVLINDLPRSEQILYLIVLPCLVFCLIVCLTVCIRSLGKWRTKRKQRKYGGAQVGGYPVGQVRGGGVVGQPYVAAPQPVYGAQGG